MSKIPKESKQTGNRFLRSGFSFKGEKVMIESVTGINIDAFKPNPQERSPQTNFHLAFLMKEFCGRGSIRFYRALRQGGALTKNDVVRFNEYAYGAIRRLYNLPPQIDPQQFYLQNQKHALSVPQYYVDLLPEVEKIELKDEVTMLSERPSDLFRYLSKPSDKIFPTLAYEIHRHTILLDISSRINARTLNSKLLTRLSDVHHVLNEKFFEGPEGAGRDINVESVHDDDTNEVIGFPKCMKRIPPTAHLKRISFTVRDLKEGGTVYTSPRKKDDKLAMIKGIAKGVKTGVINPEEDVLDPIGMIIVSMDDHLTPEEAADRVSSILKADPELDVVAIEDDSESGKDHGQANGNNFNVRKQIWFAGIPVPLELIFYDEVTYLNSRFEVGVRDINTGLYKGRSHRLFNFRRAMQAAPILFPAEVYNGTSTDLEPAFINRSKLEAQLLRDMHKIA